MTKIQTASEIALARQRKTIQDQNRMLVELKRELEAEKQARLKAEAELERAYNRPQVTDTVMQAYLEFPEMAIRMGELTPLGRDKVLLQLGQDLPYFTEVSL